MTQQNRLNFILRKIEELGSQAALARLLNRKPQQITKWIKQEQVIGEKIVRDIEERLSLPRGYLDRDANCNDESTELTVYLPSLQDEINRKYALDMQILESTGCQPENLKIMRVFDLSMSPTLAVGIFVLVDISQNEPQEGGIFVIRNKVTNGVIVCRMIKNFETNNWILRPDNLQFEKYIYNPETQEILGRLVYKLGEKL